jgi:hypothetical protein
MLIFRRSNLYFTASGMSFCERPCSAPVESGLQSALNRCSIWYVTHREWHTRCCKIQFWPLEDEHTTARNMSRYKGIVYQFGNKNKHINKTFNFIPVSRFLTILLASSLVSYEVSFVLYKFGEQHFITTRSFFDGKVACFSTIHRHYVMTLL